MAYKRKRPINLPAPYLKRLWLDQSLVDDVAAYPFCLPFLRNGFELTFDRAITIIVGENGAGKSTLLEGIAVLAGYDEAGGGKGYMPVDHSRAVEAMGGRLRRLCAQAGYRRLRTVGSFGLKAFSRWRAISTFCVGSAADFLSHSHGEGFLRFFQERCKRQGIFIFDEPESALSPTRQIEFLKLLRLMDRSGVSQVVMATHSPMLMAYPNARLLRLTKYGLEPVALEETDHFRLMREFCADPIGFVEAVVEEWKPHRRDADRF